MSKAKIEKSTDTIPTLPAVMFPLGGGSFVNLLKVTRFVCFPSDAIETGRADRINLYIESPKAEEISDPETLAALMPILRAMVFRMD